LKASEKLICEKIEKEIKSSIAAIKKTEEHSQIQITEEDLYQILDGMNFLSTQFSSDTKPSQ
jgi:hypothetical protein